MKYFLVCSTIVLLCFHHSGHATRFLPMIVWDNLNPLLKCKCSWLTIPNIDIFDQVDFVCPTLKLNVDLLDGYSRPKTEMNVNIFRRKVDKNMNMTELRKQLNDGTFCDPNLSTKLDTCEGGNDGRSLTVVFKNQNDYKTNDTVVFFSNGDGKVSTLNSKMKKCTMVFVIKITWNKGDIHDMSYRKWLNPPVGICNNGNMQCEECKTSTISPTPTLLPTTAWSLASSGSTLPISRYVSSSASAWSLASSGSTLPISRYVSSVIPTSIPRGIYIKCPIQVAENDTYMVLKCKNSGDNNMFKCSKHENISENSVRVENQDYINCIGGNENMYDCKLNISSNETNWDCKWIRGNPSSNRRKPDNDYNYYKIAFFLLCGCNVVIFAGLIVFKARKMKAGKQYLAGAETGRTEKYTNENEANSQKAIEKVKIPRNDVTETKNSVHNVNGYKNPAYTAESPTKSGCLDDVDGQVRIHLDGQQGGMNNVGFVATHEKDDELNDKTCSTVNPPSPLNEIPFNLDKVTGLQGSTDSCIQVADPDEHVYENKVPI